MRLFPSPGQLRRRAGAAIVDTGFRSLSRAGRVHPRARRRLREVSILHDVPYRDPGSDPYDPAHHHLDVYRPLGTRGRLPVVIYLHGGGFRILSKETHWALALFFARQGYLVFNADYRLAPEHPFPAAAEDACAVARFVKAEAARFGGDPDRIILAGESAGANLVTTLALAASWPRPEPWAKALYEIDLAPRAVIAACGFLQVSESSRFARRRSIPRWVQDRLDEISEAYLGTVSPQHRPEAALADPVVLLEEAEPAEIAASAQHRKLPPFFATVGTRDPVLDDTRRLAAALARLEVNVESRIYPGELHAFQAFLWRKAARDHWRRTWAFLDGALADSGSASTGPGPGGA